MNIPQTAEHALSRDYLFYDFTLSLCSTCLRRVDAKVIFQDEKVYLLKWCPEHGKEKALIATDIEYYKRCRNYIKPGELPKKFNTKTLYGCPYDCGLCPDHEQHSCLTVVEITDRCNLQCPTCYAGSGPAVGRHRSLSEVREMLDIICENEGQPDVVQLSGGEPTVHPDLFEILDYAKQLPIRHLMLNTNGIRIAKDKKFAEKLAGYVPNFEIYLQFDSFQPDVLMKLRGEDLTAIRTAALNHLNELNLSTTLVVTLQRGLNTHEMGDIIEFALKQRCVRGVTFQPTQVAGRVEHFDPATDRFTLTEARQGILDQCSRFLPEDIIPVPCNPDALAMGYALKVDGQVIPLTRYINPQDLLDGARSTIVYEQQPELREKIVQLFSTAQSPSSASNSLAALLCCLPMVSAPTLTYDSLFRVIIMQFLDPYNFDVRTVKRSCVHIVNKDGKIIPFDTMNLFYRDDRAEKLAALRSTMLQKRA